MNHREAWQSVAISVAIVAALAFVMYAGNLRHREFEARTASAIPIIHWTFAPGLDCEQATVAAVNGAKIDIFGQYYNFTDTAVADALIAAGKRNVAIRIIQDDLAFTQKNNQLQRLAAAGIECWTDANHPIAHNKVLIIDSHLVLTGSWNASEHAQENAENLVVIDDRAMAAAYHANWLKHWQEPKTLKVK